VHPALHVASGNLDYAITCSIHHTVHYGYKVQYKLLCKTTLYRAGGAPRSRLGQLRRGGAWIGRFWLLHAGFYCNTTHGTQ
jgi:hypothetical protein